MKHLHLRFSILLLFSSPCRCDSHVVVSSAKGESDKSRFVYSCKVTNEVCLQNWNNRTTATFDVYVCSIFDQILDPRLESREWHNETIHGEKLHLSEEWISNRSHCLAQTRTRKFSPLRHLKHLPQAAASEESWVSHLFAKPGQIMWSWKHEIHTEKQFILK